jgi:hypothetical protein
MTRKSRRLGRWFLISGCIGIVVAIGLAVIAAYYSVSPTLLLILWPVSIVGLANPSGVSEKIIFGVIEFGGNLVLYGVIGFLIALLVRHEPVSD